MSWNYRVIEYDDVPDGSFEIHKFFYDEKGNIKYWHGTISNPKGKTLTELMQSLRWMKDACSKPILKWSYLATLKRDAKILYILHDYKPT